MQAVKPSCVSKEESLVLLKNMARATRFIVASSIHFLNCRFGFQYLRFVSFEIFFLMIATKQNNMEQLKFINCKAQRNVIMESFL